MHAQAGDWLIVPGRTDTAHERRGEIVSVASPTGEPPYEVKWSDSDHTSLVVPGPDALVVSPERLAEMDRTAHGRMLQHG